MCIYNIHLMSDPEGNSYSFVFPRVLMFSETKLRETSRSQGKTKLPVTGLPEGPDIKCFVIFLDFHFNSNKR